MTVRWKPLLILSGLFVVVALVGLMAIATVMGSKSTADVLARARAERKAGKFENAKLDYQIALKQDGRNPEIHEEMADFYDTWAAQAPAEKKAELRGLCLASLAASAKNGPKRVEPRRRMLAEALKQDDLAEQGRWAKEVITLDPGNLDAHYALASEGLDGASPNLPEVRRHLKLIDAESPRRPRADWLAARIANLANDRPALLQILDRARAAALPEDAHPIDRMALLRLRALDCRHSPDVPALAGRVEAVTREALAAAADPAIPSARIARINLLIEEVQRNLIAMAEEQPAARERLKGYAETLDGASETIFQKSLDAKNGAELNVYLAYADHLRFRDHRDRCLVVVNQGLKSPAGVKQSGGESALGLHALAVEAILANFNDPARYDAAAPHIKSLIEGKAERFQALGHLFQGAIELEKAGMVADAQAPEVPRAEQSRLRASALGHLRIAASQLPHLAEAQARYGVALILNQEPAMGRQYLQLAQRLGNLEPQYQIWAAWSVVQAGYPEDAEPIVARMLKAIEQGSLPRTLEGTLHLLNGEIHQARRSPSDLKKAIDEYSRAFANGQDASPAVELRLAQIEVMLGRPADALKRIDWLVSKGKAGPSAENLAVLTLGELKREGDARKRLDAARARFPESGELAVLDASLRLRAKDPRAAERVLTDFLAKVPDNMAAIQQKAQILAQELDRPADARKLLGSVADTTDNSAPVVQLALLELGMQDHDAAAATIAKIRQRWKDAAAGDLLDAQLALARRDFASASANFDAALKKDPNNKIVQFYKAQLDGQSDPDSASRIFENLIRENSGKEIEGGLTLVAASQSALASIALESGNLDVAIARYRELLKDTTVVANARNIRWQLASALAAKKEWAAAKAEIAALINDPKVPPTPEDRVKAATYYRLNREDDAALAQVDAVLKAEPTFPGAVVTRAEILSRRGKHAEAMATIRRAIDGSAAAGTKAPAVFYLVMAAVESTTPPEADGYRRALVVIDRGLEAAPDAVELVKARSRVLAITQGPKAGSDYLEARAKADPKGPYRRMLLTTFRDGGDYASAERVAADLAKDDPADINAAAAQIRMVGAQAADAARRGDRAESKRVDDRAAALIYDCRTRFKGDPNFAQLECELELRRGDYTRALALAQEVDTLSKNSWVGPLLRAQVFTAKEQYREAADAYRAALDRNPRLPEARLQLAKLSLKAGQTDEAIEQARFLQDADPAQATAQAALLVEARAMAMQLGTSTQVQASRLGAIDRLNRALRDRPDFAEASYLLAEVHLMNGDRAKAIAALKAALQANPRENFALAQAVQYLAEARGKGQPATKADLDEAAALAQAASQDDPKGDRALAVANGYTRAGRAEQALPWAEKAAARQDSVMARLTLGDLMLTMSEAQADEAKGRQLQLKALEQYNKILDAQPNQVDAVNNKAWILHSYLGKSREALELAQGLLARVDPGSLPGEFFDTLGSIQEKLDRSKDAEESYRKGLGKNPDHPVLNYHMGRLMAADKARSRKAADYLKVAEAGRDRLPAGMASDLDSLLQKVSN